jgi:hypothetical protein
MAKSEIAVIVAIGLTVVALVVPLADRMTADYVSAGTGTVVDKVYSPATSSSGTGMVYGGKSGVKPVYTHTHSPEKWVVIVLHDGDTFSAECSAAVWGRCEKGKSCDVVRIQGKLMDYGHTIR